MVNKLFISFIFVLIFCFFSMQFVHSAELDLSSFKDIDLKDCPEPSIKNYKKIKYALHQINVNIFNNMKHQSAEEEKLSDMISTLTKELNTIDKKIKGKDLHRIINPIQAYLNGIGGTLDAIEEFISNSNRALKSAKKDTVESYCITNKYINLFQKELDSHDNEAEFKILMADTIRDFSTKKESIVFVLKTFDQYFIDLSELNKQTKKKVKLIWALQINIESYYDLNCKGQEGGCKYKNNTLIRGANDLTKLMVKVETSMNNVVEVVKKSVKE